MRSEYLDALAKSRPVPGDGPATVASKLREPLRRLRPAFTKNDQSESLELAFDRVIAALVQSTELVDCHAAKAKAIDVSARRGRPREFWVLCGIASVGLLLLIVALLARNWLISASTVLVLVVGAVAGAMWGLAGVKGPRQITPEASIEVDTDRAITTVEKALLHLDDAVKLLNSRFAQSVPRAGDDLPSDVLDLLHLSLGDALTGRAADRRDDIAEVLRLRSVAVVAAYESDTDYRFIFRVAPTFTTPAVARPALIRADGSVLRQGVVLVPATT